MYDIEQCKSNWNFLSKERKGSSTKRLALELVIPRFESKLRYVSLDK